MITANIQLDGLLERLDAIENLIKNISKDDDKKWITNEQFCLLLNISSKTAQSYRDKGLITFSQIGNKIYYRINHINDFLESNLKLKFNARSGK